MTGLQYAAAIAEWVLWAAAAVGVYLDIVSAVFYWRRIRDGRGPSGVPVVALVFYEGGISAIHVEKLCRSTPR